MADKISFANELIDAATILAQVGERLAALEGVFFDKGYDGGGSNPIVDSDITSTGITAAQVTAMITASQQLVNYLDNAAVTSGDYRATLNNVRADV